jgi:peptidoglycan/LPS O-acetylase OafA/YrhL
MLMNRPFSLYLDVTRLFAAVLVVLTHFVQNGLMLPGASWLPTFGREAVMVFFVLSGYVIAYTTAEKSLTLRQYAVARATRIYSAAIPVVLLCFALVYLVADAAQVPPQLTYQANKPWLYLPLHWLFMGELWQLAESPPWLVQYWSLNYEVWYYVLFGVLFYLRGKRRLLLGALVLLVMGYKLWLLLPVWLAGAALFHYQRALPLSVAAARAGWLASIAALCAYRVLGLDVALRTLGIELWPFPALRLGNADRYLADYLVCLLVCVNFALARQCAFGALLTLATPIRALSAYTFTLYLIHGPVIGMWLLFYPYQPGNVADLLLLGGCIALATWAAGWITEQRKDWCRDSVSALVLLCSRRLN